MPGSGRDGLLAGKSSGAIDVSSDQANPTWIETFGGDGANPTWIETFGGDGANTIWVGGAAGIVWGLFGGDAVKEIRHTDPTFETCVAR